HGHLVTGREQRQTVAVSPGVDLDVVRQGDDCMWLLHGLSRGLRTGSTDGRILAPVTGTTALLAPAPGPTRLPGPTGYVVLDTVEKGHAAPGRGTDATHPQQPHGDGRNRRRPRPRGQPGGGRPQ